MVHLVQHSWCICWWSTPGGIINVIEFVTISTTGNATDFGDLSLREI